MNQELVSLVGTLRSTFSSELFRRSPDAELQAHLAKAELLASRIYVEFYELPAIVRQTLSEYAAWGTRLEKKLSAANCPTTTVRGLVVSATNEKAADFDDTLRMVRDVIAMLRPLGAEYTEDIKSLIGIERQHCDRVQAALHDDMANAAKHAVSDANISKVYDEGTLQDFIRQRFPEESSAQIAESHFISGGASKYTLAIQLSGVRSLPAALVLRGDNAMSAGFGGADTAFEFRLFEILHAEGVRVPRPLAHEPSGTVFGTPFMLSERRAGSVIGHMFMLPAPDEMVGVNVATQLARIHAVPIAKLGDWMPGAELSSSGQAGRLLAKSHEAWSALQQSSSVIDTAFDWLQRHVALMDGGRALVHGDYGLNNLLIDDRQVSAVLDWEYAHIGNPAYDLGYFYDQAQALSSWDHFLEAYGAAGGRVPTQAELDYSVLFAATRLGVMVFQAIAAYRAGVATGLQAALIASNRISDVSVMRIAALLERVM